MYMSSTGICMVLPENAAVARGAGKRGHATHGVALGATDITGAGGLR